MNINTNTSRESDASVIGYIPLKGHTSLDRRYIAPLIVLYFIVTAIAVLTLYTVHDLHQLRFKYKEQFKSLSGNNEDCCSNFLYQPQIKGSVHVFPVTEPNNTLDTTEERKNKTSENMHKKSGAFSSIQISAHVAGAIVKPMPDNRAAQIMNWTVTDKADSFCSLIRHNNGKLVIPLDGIYFVYSQAQFLSYPNDGDDPRIAGHTHAQLGHFVYRWNQVYPNDGTKLLMRRSLTARWNNDSDMDQRASYMAAAFRLRENDELFVRMSNHGINDDAKATFFGAFLLGNKITKK